jgi:hypothetical protein
MKPETQALHVEPVYTKTNKLLGCDAVQSGTLVQTFWRHLLPPSSGQKNLNHTNKIQVLTIQAFSQLQLSMEQMSLQ